MDEPQPRTATIDLAALSSMLAAVAAPLTAVLAGALYLAGYTTRIAFFGRFGLDAAAVDTSLHATMAHGFMSVVLVLMVSAIVYTIYVVATSLVGRVSLRAFLRRLPKIRMDPARVTIGRYLSATGTVLGTASLVGLAVGEYTAWRVASRVSGGCAERCSTFAFKNGSFVGSLLGQDPTRVVVLTARGVIIEPAGELKSISPFRPSQVRQRVAAPDRKVGHNDRVGDVR